MLTQWFNPEPNEKGLSFAKGLLNKGYEVEVLTGFPNYPGGRIYSGYKLKLYQRENIDGVKVSRVFLYPSHDQSVIKRIINYFSFIVSSLLYYILNPACAPSLIYAYHPPITVGLCALIMGKLRKIPVVYDVQDMWPDTLKASGVINNKYILGFINIICMWVYNRVDKLVVLSPGFKKLLITRGVPANKISVIYNWADEEVLKVKEWKSSIEIQTKDGMEFLYAGNMGAAQKLETLILAAEKLQQWGSRSRILMLGSGIELNNLKKIVLEKNLNNVSFLPQVQMCEVGKYIISSDVAIIHLKNDGLFEITIPSKTQAFLAFGKPILMGVKGDAANLVKVPNAGICTEPEDYMAMAKAILKFEKMPMNQIREMGLRGLEYYSKNLSFDVGVSEFSSVFDTVIREYKET